MIMEPLFYDPGNARFRALIGVGGIGTGVFFELNGNHTLGREESRGGRFLDQRDYCKLHIIAHYVQTLLGPAFITVPIGYVGQDAPGERLLQEMKSAGFDMGYVSALPNEQTLFSTCFIYPDGSGGNLTTEDSANAKVGPAEVKKAEKVLKRFMGSGIALAAPEVSLETRRELLVSATAHDLFRAASLITEEMLDPSASDILSRVDLLAINLEEAAALAGFRMDEAGQSEIVEKAVMEAMRHKPDIWVTVTAGKNGSWGWDGERMWRFSAIPVEVTNTAGAGDAFFGGILAGLATGLSLGYAQELGRLVAAMAVTSPHTIHPGIDRISLASFVDSQVIDLSHEVRQLLR